VADILEDAEMRILAAQRHSAALSNAEQYSVPSACQYPFLSNLYKSLYSLAALLISHKIEMAKTAKKKHI